MAFSLLFFAAPVFSQNEYESEVPSRETEAQAKARKTAAQARQRVPFEGKQVTYEQVLADPDNIGLNFDYAKIQIVRGDVKGSAATLERLLLVNPMLEKVRLLYGVVLFRLDNLEEAERMLDSVREMKITDSLRGEVDNYLRQIHLRRKRTRWTASVTAGFEFDSNRNAASSSKQRLVADAPTGLGSSSRKRDTSFLGIQSFKVSHDLGTQAGHQLFASFDHFLQEQTVVNSLDLESFSGEAGGSFKIGPAVFTPSAEIGNIRLSRETFLRTQGGALRLDRRVNEKWVLFCNGRWVREDYTGISENSAAPQRRGHRATMELGTNYVLNPAMRIDVSGSLITKYAKAAYYEYDGYVAQAGHTWLPGKGQFLTNSFSYEMDAYDDPDFAISARTRRDEKYRYRLTYGAPVSFFIGKKILPKFILDDLTATVIYEQFRAISNVQNYTYTNSKAVVLLTKTVEF